MVVDKNSATIEDYLEFLFVMQRDQIPVIGARLAELLGVSPPTVTNTLKRMSRDGLVTISDPQGTSLTQKGLEMAGSVMRRHMLTEWLLLKMLKIPWSQTHLEAHGMEHAISDQIEEQMRANLGDPKTCPHGNPMPGFEYVTSQWTALIDVRPGELVTIRRIHEMGEGNAELLAFLESNHIVPGSQWVVTEVLAFNQTMTLKSSDRDVSLGFALARFIHIEK